MQAKALALALAITTGIDDRRRLVQELVDTFVRANFCQPTYTSWKVSNERYATDESSLATSE